MSDGKIPRNSSGRTLRQTSARLKRNAAGDSSCCCDEGCPSDWDCEHCAETPATIGVTLSGVTLCGCFTVSGMGAIHSIRITSGAVNGTYCMSNTSGAPCVWAHEVESGGPVELTRYASSDCSGAPYDTYTDFHVVLTRTSTNWILAVYCGYVDFFYNTIAASGSDCMTEQSFSNQYTSGDCGGIAVITSRIAGYDGSASTEACCEVGI